MSDPIFFAIRIFHGDDGWWWRIESWSGDVDTRNTPPHRSQESKRSYVTRRGAFAAATRALIGWRIG